jgi:putative tributyrin esterase
MRSSVNKHFAKLLWVVLVLGVSICASAQTAQTKTADKQSSAQSKTGVTVRDLKLDSKLMSRQMPYRVITPANYESGGTEKFAVVYLLHGLTGHFSDWADRTKLKDLAANYRYIIVMPEGDNGWYSDSATIERDKYESYIVGELIPEIDKNYRTFALRSHRGIAGLSMGGYGSLKFGLKYPEMFSLAGSFSGALQAASFTDKTLGNGWKTLTDSIMSVYGAENSRVRAENDIYKITRELSAAQAGNLPFFYLDCGTEDGLIGSNREFAALLLEKKIPHEFRQLPGKHDWQYWNSQVKEFLELTEKHFTRLKAKAN